MSYIIDASVAAKWFFREDLHEESLLLLNLFQWITAPDCIHYEVCNVCKKKVDRREIALEHAQFVVANFPKHFNKTTASKIIIENSFNLSVELNHSPYDCFYLADAISKDFILVTADKEFVKKVEKSKWASSIMMLQKLPYEHNSHILGQSSLTKTKLDHIMSLCKALEPEKRQHLHDSNEDHMVVKHQRYMKTPAYMSFNSYIESLSLEEKSVLLYIDFLNRFSNIQRTRYDILYALFWSRHSTPYVNSSYICANTAWPDIELGYRIHIEYAKSILNDQIIICD